MLFAIIAFVVGVIVGAFSHKWLAAEAAKAGINAQADANVAKAAIAPAVAVVKDAVKKV